MAKLLKLRRGTTTQHSSFTGAEGEVTVDMTKDTIVVHDGGTQGGHPLAKENMTNVSSSSIAGRLATDSISPAKIGGGTLGTDVKITDSNINGNLTIQNSDVTSGAAIAGTKISPAFGSQNLSTSGTAATGALTVSGNIAVSGTVDGRDLASDGSKLDGIESGATADQTAAQIKSAYESNSNTNAFTDSDHARLDALSTSNGVLKNGVTATTQSAGTSNTRVATTAFVGTAITNLIDSSPSALNTLNELAAAINDDANFSTTITNSIATKMPLAGGTFTGAVTGTTFADSKGDVRSIPLNSKSSSYTLTLADAGKAIYISSGGVTIPSSVMAAGNAVTIVNDSGSNQTITQGSGLTLYNTADAATGNRTLLPRGITTVWFAATATAYISGSGLE